MAIAKLKTETVNTVRLNLTIEQALALRLITGNIVHNDVTGPIFKALDRIFPDADLPIMPEVKLNFDAIKQEAMEWHAEQVD